MKLKCGGNKMKAWFLTGPSKLSLQEVEEPQLQPGYLIAEVLTAQASVTEANMISLEDNPFGMLDKINKYGKVSLPGHEMCARVVKVNYGSKFEVGERISTLAKIVCGKCPGCLRSDYRGCSNEHLMGVTLDGVFAERILIPESGLIKVPEKLTNSEAANLQPLADCVGAIDSLKTFRLGVSVAIFGAGCLGLNTLQVANATGAGKTIIVDIKEENLKLAKELGVDHVINGLTDDPVKAIKDLTGGIGADIVIEAAGGNPKRGLAGTVALQQAVKAVKPEGELHVLAIYGPSVEFPIGEMRTYGKLMSTPIFTNLMHMKRGANLIANGQLKIEPMISHKLDGIEQVPKMFEITGNKSSVKSINPAQVNIMK